MRNIFIRISTAVLTFTIGVALVFLIKQFIFSPQSVENVSPNALESFKTSDKGSILSPDAQVVVNFKGFIKDENGLAAKMEIVNYNSAPAFYFAYPADENDTVGQAFSFGKVNGKEIEEWRCGNGFKKFQLKPGESMTQIVNGWRLSYFLERGRNLQLGFNFSIGDEDHYKEYWSDDLEIPDSIRSQLLKEEAERRKNY